MITRREDTGIMVVCGKTDFNNQAIYYSKIIMHKSAHKRSWRLSTTKYITQYYNSTVAFLMEKACILLAFCISSLGLVVRII